MKIENVEVFGLEGSIRASKFPMAVSVDQLNGQITPTSIKLGSSGMGEGHDNFLLGIVVQFDLTFTIKAWTEMERYHFCDIVSSQSTMHRIAKFDVAEQCNEYVNEVSINNVKELTKQYNDDSTPENYLKLLYNVPVGFQLTARMTTNYRQLKTIYYQRRNHRLPEWREFCKWIESLPSFQELVLANDK